jgi:hypothetical protein
VGGRSCDGPASASETPQPLLEGSVCPELSKEGTMNSIIYLVGLVVIVMAILSFVGFR